MPRRLVGNFVVAACLLAGCRSKPAAPPPASSQQQQPRVHPLRAFHDCDQRWFRGCMFRIPGGTFLMGAQRSAPASPRFDPAAQDDETPHLVELAPFWMRQTEVEVEFFDACVSEGACDLADVEASGGYFNFRNPLREHHPVNGVTWKGADAFCRWIGGRLPTEAEWEYVARGAGTDRRYPWGDEPPRCPFAVMNNGCGDGSTTRGENRKGGEVFVIRNLAGNVWEWTADWYAPDYYARAPRKDPRGPASPVDGAGRVQRGGGWSSTDPAELRASGRSQMAPDVKLSDIGFRCVTDDPPPSLK